MSNGSLPTRARIFSFLMIYLSEANELPPPTRAKCRSIRQDNSWRSCLQGRQRTPENDENTSSMIASSSVHEYLSIGGEPVFGEVVYLISLSVYGLLPLLYKSRCPFIDHAVNSLGPRGK